MSANILQSYLIKLGTSVDRKGLDGFVGAVTSGISTVAKFGAAAAAFASVHAGMMKLASSEDALNDLSERVGVSVENIERLGYVATLSGSSTGALQNALENLSGMAGRAAMGMEGAERIFGDIGLNIRNSSGSIKSATELFEDLKKALAGMDRNSQIAALDRLRIDRSLLQSLTTDASGLKAEFDEMAKATGVDFEKTAKAASDLNDEVDKTGTFIRLTTKVFGADLMGQTTDMLRRFRGWIRDNGEDTLFYCDPPYIGTAGYACRFTMCDHERLRDTLATIKGKAIVSLNDCPETRQLYDGWDIRELGVSYSVGGRGADRRKRNGEVVIRHCP